MKARSTRSPSGASARTASTCLGTGALSPVRADFIDLERGGADEAAVSGHQVTGLDHDDVARDQLLHGQLDDLPVAQDPGLDDHHRLEGSDARLSLALLVEAR